MDSGPFVPFGVNGAFEPRQTFSLESGVPLFRLLSRDVRAILQPTGYQRKECLSLLRRREHGIITNGDAPGYLKQLEEKAEVYIRFVENLLEQGKSVEEIADMVRYRELDVKSFLKQPLTAYMPNTERRIQTIKKRLEKRRRSRTHRVDPKAERRSIFKEYLLIKKCYRVLS